MLKEHYWTVNVDEQVCSCWVELSCSAKEKPVVAQGKEATDSSIRETRAEKLDDARRAWGKKTLFDLSIAEAEREEGLKGLFEVE